MTFYTVITNCCLAFLLILQCYHFLVDIIFGIFYQLNKYHFSYAEMQGNINHFLSLTVFNSFLCTIYMSLLQAMTELGPVDMLVNSAGISFPGEFDNLSIDQFRVSTHLALQFSILTFVLLA